MATQETIKYGDYDITKDWMYVTNPYAGDSRTSGSTFYFNPNDTTQKFLLGSDDPNIQEFLSADNRQARLDYTDLGQYYTNETPGRYDFMNIFSGQTLEQIAEQQRLQSLAQSVSSGQTSVTQGNLAANDPNLQGTAPTFNLPLAYQPTGNQPIDPSISKSPGTAKTALVDGVRIDLATGQPYTSQGRSPLELAQDLASTSTAFSLTGGMLKQGVYNNDNVKQLQSLLGITADGDFGPMTKQAVINFQKANGLTPDGIVGPLTVAALNAKYGKAPTGGTGTSGGAVPSGTGGQVNLGGIQGQTPTYSSPVGTSTQARASATQAKMAELQKSLGLGEAPKAPDLFTSKDELILKQARADRASINEDLANIMNQKLAMQEELEQYSHWSSKGMSMGGMTGAVSEKERELTFRMNALNRQELVLETKLANRNATISELMGLQRQEFVDAENAYNAQYSRALQLYGIIDEEEDELKTDARANLDVLANAFGAQLTSGTIQSLSSTQIRQLEQLELQAGLPLGSTLAMLQTMGPEDEKLYSGIDDAGNFVYITKNSATGEISTKKISGAAYVKPTGGSGGLTQAQINSTVNSIAGAFDNEQIVKDYNAASAQTQLMQSIGTRTSSPGDDIAFVYAFAKLMDPNSVVREGEYATIQKYAQSLLSKTELDAVRTVKNSNFLSQDAKQKLLTTAMSKIKVLENQYTNVYNEYQRQIQDAYTGQPRQITNYAGGNTISPDMSVAPTEETQQEQNFWGSISNFLFGSD